jgi:hypothetical protein
MHHIEGFDHTRFGEPANAGMAARSMTVKMMTTNKTRLKARRHRFSI